MSWATPALIALTGNTTLGLARAIDLGPVDPTMRLSIDVGLRLRNGPELAAFIERISTPSSPLFGRSLSVWQTTRRFGPLLSQVRSVTAYLRGSGLSDVRVSANRLLVSATGTVAQLNRTFHVSVDLWRDARSGRRFYANATNPSVPAGIAPFVLGVFGLNDYAPQHPAGSFAGRLAGPLASDCGSAGGFTPTQIQTAYDLTPLLQAGYSGIGQQVGLFELDGFELNNIHTFDGACGLNSPDPIVIPVDGGVTLGSGQSEVELDIEVVNEVAPSAQITVWEGPNTDQGVLDTYNAMVQANTTRVNSTSWVVCEPNVSTTFLDQLDAIFQLGAAQGQGFFASSGDAGAYGCGDSNLEVVSPASDPYVTGVGGTTLTLNGNGSYKSEDAWWDPNSHSHGQLGDGTGGGLSIHFPLPSWETGPGVSNQYSNGMRQVPDVSSDGDYNSSPYSVYLVGQWTTNGGTSAAAPSWAAMMALNDQFALAHGRAALGFANPSLYWVRSGHSPSQPFEGMVDVGLGTNGYYAATARWDFATGWGSYFAYNLVRDLCYRVGPINEFCTASGNTAPQDIVTGPDGNLWFTESGANSIGVVSPAGEFTEHFIHEYSVPWGITSGPDQSVWFAETIGNQIGKITIAGAISEFRTPHRHSPYEITAGPDGNLWFTEPYSNRIGRMTPTGTFTEFKVPGGPWGITPGPDGNLWFAMGDRVGRITPAGAVTTYKVTRNGGASSITKGPDGNLWFSEETANKVGRITTGGVFTPFRIRTANSSPCGISAGPDGNVWFTERSGNRVGRITPSGAVTEYMVPTAGSQPCGIVTGSDGNVWFTELSTSTIGQKTLP